MVQKVGNEKMVSYKSRPFGITALAVLFVFGTAASFIAAVSLSFPGSFLEPIWQLNPQARTGFDRIGSWAMVLMVSVCIACMLAAVSVWRGLSWGYWLAVGMLVLNLIGDVINVITGTEPRAIVGIPVVFLVLTYLMRRRTRNYFRK
jgi:hypothetical protein